MQFPNVICNLRAHQHEFEGRIQFLDKLLHSEINTGREAQGNLKREVKWTRERIKELDLAIKRLEEE